MNISFLNFGENFGVNKCKRILMILMTLPVLLVSLFVEFGMISNHKPTVVAVIFQLVLLVVYAFRSILSSELFAKLQHDHQFASEYLLEKCLNKDTIMYNLSIWSYNNLESRHREAYTMWLLENADTESNFFMEWTDWASSMRAGIKKVNHVTGI